MAFARSLVHTHDVSSSSRPAESSTGDVMNVERWVRLIGGGFVAASVLLGMYVNVNFLWFTLFVGLNLFQSGFTNWCPMMTFLRKAGVRG
jgi:hypothetical protein